MIVIRLNDAAEKDYTDNGVLAAWAWAQTQFGDPSLTKTRRWFLYPQWRRPPYFVFSHKKDAKLFADRWGNEYRQF